LKTKAQKRKEIYQHLINKNSI